MKHVESTFLSYTRIWEFNSLETIPSQSDKNCDFIVKFQSRSRGFLFRVKESISSIKMTQGFILRAKVKRASKYFSVSPTHLSSTKDNGSTKNLNWASLAIALANSVFPQPGGPYKRIPMGAFNKFPFGW